MLTPRRDRWAAFDVGLAMLLVILNGTDWAITKHAVEHWGARELNPLMAPLIGSGVDVVLKLLLPLVVLLCMVLIEVPTRIRWLLGAVTLLYVGIVGWGLFQLAGM